MLGCVFVCVWVCVFRGSGRGLHVGKSIFVIKFLVHINLVLMRLVRILAWGMWKLLVEA